MHFLDQAKIFIRSGAGGAGAVAFRREKFVEYGGPDGGNGGKGGDIVFEAVAGLNTLIDFRYTQHFRAARGKGGSGSNMTGAGGDDLVVQVPVGTQILADDEDRTLLADFTTEGQTIHFLRGGDGGRGNASYKTSTNRAPRQHGPGWPGEERYVWLRLKLLADCGLLGLPNAGKSTLVNALVGQKVAIVSPKAQTTRARLMGIAIEEQAQLLLVDTPGIFAPRRRLDRAMVKAAWEGAEDADRLVLVIDAAAKVGPRVEQVIEGVEARSEPKILVLNKVDIADKGQLLTIAQRLAERLKPEQIFMISSTTGDGVEDLKAHLAAAMPTGPWQFPDDQLTDATDRMVAAELTREQLYLQLHAEVPYSAAVETEKWEDRKDGSTVIHQQILIERDSQKAIVVGKGGARLKAIGQASREAIAEHLGRKVHLFLHVKVNPKWDEDRGLYEDIGLDWAD